MGKLDFGNLDDEDTSAENKVLYNNFRAFMDTLNNTLDSSSESSVSDIKRLSKQIKSLSKDYESQLAKMGITISDSGYWTVDKDTFDSVDNKKFEKIFGDDSEFSSAVKKIAKKLRKRINTLV